MKKEKIEADRAAYWDKVRNNKQTFERWEVTRHEGANGSVFFKKKRLIASGVVCTVEQQALNNAPLLQSSNTYFEAILDTDTGDEFVLVEAIRNYFPN